MGAFEPCASSTSFRMRATAVSFPTFVARYLIKPVLLMLAPMTVSPIFFVIGSNSDNC